MNLVQIKQPVPSDSPEGIGYLRTIQQISEITADWDTGCREAGYLQQEPEVSQSGAFDIIRQGEEVSTRAESNELADTPDTDAYRVIIHAVRDVQGAFARFYTLHHLSGNPFLKDPIANEVLEMLALEAHGFGDGDMPSTARIEVGERTVDNMHRSVVFSANHGKLVIDTQAGSSGLLENDHT